MPTQHEILANLGRIANEATLVAVAWHGLVAFVVASFLIRARPSRRLAALGLSLPLASVGAVAWAWRNPFNGAVFSLVAVVLAVLAWRAPNERVQLGSTWAVAFGSALVAFGWAYPHFLETKSSFVYLYAAALGTIPCPTLSLVIGLALVTANLGGPAWRFLLAATGLAYGLIGALRLGVAIDVVLVLGAASLLAREIVESARVHREARV